MKILLVLPIALIAGCTAVGDVTRPVVDAYRDQVCDGAITDLARGEARAEFYALNGVVVYVDCDWTPGKTLVEFEE